MSVIAEIEESWGWVGIEPIEIVGESDFGNLMIKDKSGCYWRLCPEELYCRVVAQNREELDRLSTDQEFLGDWYMQGLLEQAKECLGPLEGNRKFYLVTPRVLGGEYVVSNVRTLPLIELIRISGYLGHQIDGLPDGAQIHLKVVD